MNVDELFATLSPFAVKVAARSMLDADDIRQELYLMCMEVTEGRSAYSPVIGGVNEYIMGRLWGLVKRWEVSLSVEGLAEQNSDEVPVTGLDSISSLSVEDELLLRQTWLDQDALDVQERLSQQEKWQGQSTLAVLMQQGHWSFRDAAKFCGVSIGAIQKCCC